MNRHPLITVEPLDEVEMGRVDVRAPPLEGSPQQHDQPPADPVVPTRSQHSHRHHHMRPHRSRKRWRRRVRMVAVAALVLAAVLISFWVLMGACQPYH